MSSAICFNLDQSKILLSGNGLKQANQSFGHNIICNKHQLRMTGVKYLLMLIFLTVKRPVYITIQFVNPFPNTPFSDSPDFKETADDN